MVGTRIHGRREVLLDDRRLFEAATTRSALEAGWSRVWANGGAAGGDGVTVQRFLSRAPSAIGRLANDLREGRYRPSPFRFVDIPKRNGGTRRLSIPCVLDRIVQTAVAQTLSPLLEEEFEDASFGYRPGRSVGQAVERVGALRAAGYRHVVDADIDGYFDAIPHDLLIGRLGESLTDGPLTRLIGLWLADYAPHGRGVPQGSPLSPLLANLFLDRLDEKLSTKGARIVRFADDFVVLTATTGGAAEALERVRQLLWEHGLKLNAEKTRVTDFDRGFRFLGHLFLRSLVLKAEDEDAANDVDALLAEVGRHDAEDEERRVAAAETLAEQEGRGFSPGLRNLYITERGRRLGIRNQAFVVEELRARPQRGEEPAEEDWCELIAVPHQRLDRIDLHPGVGYTPAALEHALATDTVVAFVDGYGATKGLLAPTLGERAERHLAQAAVLNDPERRRAMARTIVEGRLRNQRSLLRKLLRETDSETPDVVEAIAELTHLIGRGDTSRIRQAPTIPALMGYEGAAAAAYWKAIGRLCHPEFRFAKRERRESVHRAGIALDVLAWLLNRDTRVACQRAGLHPGFGVLHEASDHQDACVYDLMEEMRTTCIEGLFVYLTNRRILRTEMFVEEGQGVRLLPEGMQALIRAYETRMNMLTAVADRSRRVTFRRLLVEQAFAYARSCETGEPYQPHVAKN